VIAHSLELVGHVQEPEDLAKIARHRSLGEDHRQAMLVDLGLARVDLGIAADDRRRHVHVAVEKGTGGTVDGHVDHLPHLQHQVAHLPLLGVQRGPMRMSA